MNDIFLIIFIIYMIIMNIAAISVTVYDKYAAKNAKWRIKESTLLILSALSGCVLQYVTMRLIHHKTRKLKFMLGVPVIFILEISAFLLIYYFKNGFAF